MTAVKILIVEDELIIAEAIASSLTKFGYTVTEKVSNYSDALQALTRVKPDVVILDINLGSKKDGIDVASEIRKTSSVPIIFLTDHDDKKTTVRAFKASPAAFLIKPFNEKQILVSIQQALSNTSSKRLPDSEEKEDVNGHNYVLNNCLFIRKDKDSPYRKIPLQNILMIEADRAYSIIHTSDATYLQTISMNKVFEQIKHPSFVQVHRSYVVNLDNVEGIKGNMLIIRNKEIQIGESHREDVIKRLPMLR